MFITPNQISFIRILLTPLIFALILYPINSIGLYWQTYLVGSLFTIVSLTDFIDGYLARKYNLQSTLGEILDPLADKMLITSTFIALLYIGKIEPWSVFLILSREYFITGIRIILASHKVDIKSSFIGKIKTVAQMFAIGFAIMGWIGADVLLFIAVVLTIYSGIEYTINSLKEIKRLNIDILKNNK
jgi:CDP-diacylglycerol--glycerol-3-phosphate 3-phosphatidyltransferase